MMISAKRISSNNGLLDITLYVESSWAGNSVTGELSKKLFEKTGSYHDLEDKFKQSFVTVFFDPNLLARMTPEMIIAVLSDYETLKKKVGGSQLRWL